MKEKRILTVFGQVDEKYIEEAIPNKTVVAEKAIKKWSKKRIIIVAIAAAIMLLSSVCALAAGMGFNIFELIAEALADEDPAFIQEQLDEGQWAYLSDNDIAVIVPESPVKILLSDDGGTTWRETIITESKGMDFLGSWRDEMQYRSGYIGFNGENDGYLLLASGVSMNHQALRIFLTSDGGNTWSEIGTPYEQHISVITGCGFASDKIGFISYRHYADFGPDIWWTKDGGTTWSRLEVELPQKYQSEKYSFTPQSPCFNGMNGQYPITVINGEDETTISMHTTDGGLTWYFAESETNANSQQ